MKIFEDNSKKGNKSVKTKAIAGSFEDMLKMRKKVKQELEDNIEEVFKNYNGEMVAVIRIHEDENGDPESARVFCGGVASIQSSIKMMEALDETSNDIKKHVGSTVAEHPEALGAMLGEVLGDALEQIKKLSKGLED